MDGTNTNTEDEHRELVVLERSWLRHAVVIALVDLGASRRSPTWWSG